VRWQAGICGSVTVAMFTLAVGSALAQDRPPAVRVAPTAPLRVIDSAGQTIGELLAPNIISLTLKDGRVGFIELNARGFTERGLRLWYESPNCSGAGYLHPDESGELPRIGPHVGGRASTTLYLPSGISTTRTLRSHRLFASSGAHSCTELSAAFESPTFIPEGLTINATPPFRVVR
jgi:hypothetical protein